VRIYLDSCVIQDLKKKEYSHVYDLIKEDKSQNVYCYSEAHMQDLRMDKSDAKYDDLKFLESIVDSNCWHYAEKIAYDIIKPKEYFNQFPTLSEELINLDNLFSDDPSTELFKILLQGIPITLNILCPRDTLPTDFPDNLMSLLDQPTNMYDLICAFSDFTSELTSEQKKFKELISFIHRNAFGKLIYEKIGIYGFNGMEITDKKKFRESYNAYFVNTYKSKNHYDLFLNQYNSLEFLNIVKGKPKKQKMMGLINDGRHAFFGGFCDVVVSKDQDFLNKTAFLYDVYEIETEVYDFKEYQSLITRRGEDYALGLADMIKETHSIKNKKVLFENDGITLLQLTKTYYSYFNVIALVSNEHGKYYYFTREIQNMSTGTLRNEFEILTRELVSVLGVDANGRSQFHWKEIKDEKWNGRIWQIDDTVIELNFKDKIYLAFFPKKETKVQNNNES